MINTQKIKKYGLLYSAKKMFIFLYQKTRVCFYKLISLNKPDLQACTLSQPVYFLGQGSIVARNVQFGVTNSPFFLSGYSYIEARSEGAHIEIGEHTIINNNAAVIADKTSIHIGSRCLIGSGFTIFDSDFHNLDNHANAHYETKKVIIADNVFIGNNVTITKGVVVGKNSVIGSGSVVTKNVPENSVFAGNPARFIRDLKDSISKGEE